MDDTEGIKKKAELNRRSSLVDRIEHELRRRIVQGVYRPHLYLPSERQLAQDFHTSRVTVGKALAALERDGLVMRARGRGTRVLPAAERLSQPLIGVIHGRNVTGDPSATEAAHVQGSLRALQGVKETLERLGCRYELMSVPRPHELGADDFTARFGAMVFMEGFHGDHRELLELIRRNVPLVVAKSEVDLDVCATWVDHQDSTRQAVETFVNLGHQRIALVAREPSYAFYQRAHQGYVAGLREAELPVDESLIAACEKTDALSGYFAAKHLLESPEPPTAIVAARDAIAEGVCRAIQEAGLLVGFHVSVIGFDDTTWPEGRDFLTTFREPCYEMGAAAAEMLVDRIVNGPMPIEKRKFETTFLLRRSAGPYIHPSQYQSIETSPLVHSGGQREPSRDWDG